MKNLKLKNSGITLIALVITIIVLIILAGISISMISGQDGILKRTGNASVQNDLATTKEKIKLELIGKYNTDGRYTNADVITAVKNATGKDVAEGDKIVSTKKGNELNIWGLWRGRQGIKVGDYIDYKPDNATAYSKDNLSQNITGSSDNNSDLIQDNLNWQVLRINEDDSMDLIASPTSGSVYFSGAVGYNNCVYVLNDICKSLYGKASKGVEARSVNEEDFNKWITDDEKNEDGTIKTKGGKTTRAEFKSEHGNIIYGAKNTYKGVYSYKPDIYGKTNNESDKYYQTITDKTSSREYGKDGKTYTLDVTETLYGLAINSTNYGEGAKALASTSYYWVATRFVDCNDYFANFGLRNAEKNIAGDDMYYSKDTNENYNNRLRPVVTIKANVEVTPCEGENGTNNMHSINW